MIDPSIIAFPIKEEEIFPTSEIVDTDCFDLRSTLAVCMREYGKMGARKYDMESHQKQVQVAEWDNVSQKMIYQDIRRVYQEIESS